jgi:phosphosulfolactate phosphohydrolase-like enzyme
MANEKYLKQMEELIEKAEKIKEGYKKTSEETVKQYKEAEKAYNEAYDNYRMAYKSYVMNEITKEAMKEIEADMKQKEEVLRELGYKLDVIEEYLKEDLVEVTTKMSEIQQDFIKEKMAKYAEIKAKMKKAKLDYLKALYEASKEYGRTYRAEYKHAELLKELGLKKDIYISAPADTFNDGESLINRSEIYEALRGKFPYELVQKVKLAEEKGII